MMKIAFNSDDDLPLKKITLKLYFILLVIRSAFSDSSKYYPQVFR